MRNSSSSSRVTFAYLHESIRLRELVGNRLLSALVNGGVKQVPASPILAFETPLYLGSACDNLAQAFTDVPSRQLLLIPTFAVDVMCIKPFDEGTGRLARLFSLLLSEKAGFDAHKYVSIDRLCEKNAALGYQTLNDCLGNWEDEGCDYSPLVFLRLSLVKGSLRPAL